MVYGKTFQGPVSQPRNPNESLVHLLTQYQNFEAIIGQPLQIKGEHETEAVQEKSETSTKA